MNNPRRHGRKRRPDPDNNGDGQTNALDRQFKLVVGITNVSRQEVTGVRAVIPEDPIQLTSLTEDLNIWVTPVGTPSGDFGSIPPGAANAVRRTNVYEATDRTYAEASILIQGKVGAASVQARGKGLVNVGGETLVEARFDVEDRPYRSGQPVRVLGSIRNVSRFRNNRGEVIDEGKTVGVVIYPSIEGNGAGRFCFPRGSDGRTPDGPTSFILAPDETIEIAAIIPTAEGKIGRTGQPWTIFTLGRFIDTGGGSKYIYAFGTRNFSGLMMTLARRSSDGAYHCDGAAERVADDVIPGTGFRVFTQVFGADSPDRHRLDVDLRTVLDTRTTVGRAYSAVATNVVLGRYISGGFDFDGDLAEWIVYDRALSSRERLQVEEYLRQHAALPSFFAPGSLSLDSFESSDDPAGEMIAEWRSDTGQRAVHIPAAADPALLLAPPGAPDPSELRARLRSDGNSGWIGFAFGWISDGSFLLFDWNRAATSHPVFGTAPAGMRLREFHLPDAQKPTAADLWSGGDPARITPLAANEIPWVPGVDYDLTVRLSPDSIVLTVQEGTNVVTTWPIEVSEPVTGRFGFYAAHAAGARFGALQLPGAPMVVTQMPASLGTPGTIAWLNDQPPFVILANTHLLTPDWTDVTPATPNHSQQLPPLSPPVFLRVRGAQ